MLALRLCLSALLVVSAALGNGAGDGDEAPARRSLVSLHLGSFSSMLAGRLDDDTTLDSGAGVLRLADGEGHPLELHGFAYGRQPNLWARFSFELDGLTVQARALGATQDRGGDRRLVCQMQLTFANRAREEQTVHLSGRLSAGGGEPAGRPLPALPFDPSARFTREGKLIARDGAALLRWVGPDPELQLAESVAGPDEPVASMNWSLTLAPKSTRYLDLLLVGPPTGTERDESLFRSVLADTNFDLTQEQLDWQSMYRGRFADFESSDEQMRIAMVSAVHTLRMLGVANRSVEEITEQPYGHPPRDAAVRAEALGVFAEWGLGSWAESGIRQMATEAIEAGADLSPERRLALVHGLVRAVRVGVDDALVHQAAAAVRALITEPASVQPWLDPAEVAADLKSILARAALLGDADDEYVLPDFAWAPEPVEPVARLMASMRSALSDGRAQEAWSLYQQVLDTTDMRGMGSLAGDGTVDGGFALGLMALTRAMLVDDRGDDVRMCPSVVLDMIPDLGQLHLPAMPTRFGVIDVSVHWVGKARNRLVAQVFDQGMLIPGRILLEGPAGVSVSGLQGQFGGEAELLADGAIECRPDPMMAKGVRFYMLLRKD